MELIETTLLTEKQTAEITKIACEAALEFTGAFNKLESLGRLLESVGCSFDGSDLIYELKNGRIGISDLDSFEEEFGKEYKERQINARKLTLAELKQIRPALVLETTFVVHPDGSCLPIIYAGHACYVNSFPERKSDLMLSPNFGYYVTNFDKELSPEQLTVVEYLESIMTEERAKLFKRNFELRLRQVKRREEIKMNPHGFVFF